VGRRNCESAQKLALEDNLGGRDLSGRERTVLYDDGYRKRGTRALGQNPIFSVDVPMQGSGLPMKTSVFVHHVQIGWPTCHSS